MGNTINNTKSAQKLSARTRKGRETIAGLIRTELTGLADNVTVRESTDGDYIFVTAVSAAISVSLNIGQPYGSSNPLLLAHWFDAAEPIQPMNDAWLMINDYHRKKATTAVVSWEHMLASLKKGFQYAVSGRAFASKEQWKEIQT